MLLTDTIALVFLLFTLGAQILYPRSFWFTLLTFLEKKVRRVNSSTQTSRDLGGQSPYELKPQVVFQRFLKIIWIVSIVAIFGILTYWSVLQYELWQNQKFTQGLLPPYQNIGYFISYVGVRFFGPWVLALLAAVIVGGLAKFLNKKFGERFFENEEIKFITLGIFLTGYPGFLFYLAIILVLGALVSVFYTLLKKGRLPLYYFWMLFAVFAIIMKNTILPMFSGFQSFWLQFALGDFYQLIFGF